MATPQVARKVRLLRGATPISDHEHALASVQAGSRRARFSPPTGWRRGCARRGDDAVPRAGRTSRSANCDINSRAHDGSLSRRSRCLGLDALASARFDRRASCRRGRPTCSHARCRGSRLPFLPARLRSRRLSAGAGPAHGGGGRSLLPDWTRRTRAAALRADLTDLGITDVAAATAPPLAGAAGMFGALYVLEGSRLGARLLVPDLLAGGSAQVRAATRYLRHGEGHRLWQSFLAHLESSQPVRAVP